VVKIATFAKPPTIMGNRKKTATTNITDIKIGLLDNIFKKTTLDQIKTSFHFLKGDFLYKLLRAEKVESYRADNFLVYRTNQSKLQIEICADKSWFHCEFRRIVNGNPANHSDKLNTMDFEGLAVLESNNKYNHFDYYAGGSMGLAGVLENTANLLKRNSTFLTTDNWIEVEKIGSTTNLMQIRH